MSNPLDREVAVFSAARRLPADERAAYLDATCAGDAALRQRVEELLQASEEALDFLQDSPPGTTIRVSSITEKAGDKIGRYKLLQQIGEGGCGVVYMAEQEEPVRRRVALKVIKLGMDTKQVVARFEAERQALALMDHPNIAKVLDAGATEAGRPYFVMELVRGIKITQYCDENNLSTEQRLDLFIKVCQAVQHAHQKGIIHRDLKPSNILVADHDGVPVPKIIDFGIAKATTDQRLTDKTLFTAFEQFIGTPAYMSPEQAKLSGLDIDTRTDIYSLGVLLYELLTGKTPFDAQELLAAGLDEMRRTIREKEPARPSTRLSTMLAADLSAVAKHHQCESSKLTSSIRGDLDWMVMKCLEKDRTRRYDTASALVNDIQRHLNNEPVVARPPTQFYRFQKMVRRNKLAFAASVGVGAALVIGLGLATWQFLEKGRAYQRAVLAEQAQTRLRLQAEAEKKKAQIEAAKSQQVAQFLKEMLKGVGPSVAVGRDTQLLREILDRTVERMGKDLANQPEVELELCLTLADTYHDLGLYKQIEGLARHSLQLARVQLGEENESVALSLIWLGDSLQHIAQVHFGNLHADNLEEADRRAHDPTLVESEKCCREGLAMTRRLLGNDNLKVAHALYQLGGVLAVQSRMAEAESIHREALAMYRKLHGNEDAMVAKVLYELAIFLVHQNTRLAEAETMTREALVIERKLLGQDHPDIAKSLLGLALVLDRQEKLAEAETTCREVVTMWRKLKADDRIELANALNSLAQILFRQDKFEEGLTTFREALAMERRVFGNEHPDLLNSLTRLGMGLTRQGKWAEAETIYREELAMKRKIFGNENLDVAIAVNDVVEMLQQQGKLAEAETLCRDELASAMAMFKRSTPNDPKRGEYARCLGFSQQRLSQLLSKAGRSDQAEQFLREDLQVFEQAARDFPAELLLRQEEADSHSLLAHALNKLGRVDDAEREHRLAIATFAGLKDAAPTNLDYWGYEARSIESLGDMLEHAGQREAAATQYRQAIALFQKADATFTNQPWIKSQLARLLRQKGKLAGIEGVNRAVVELYRKNAEGGDPWALNELARFLATCADSTVRDGPAAVAAAEKAVAATHRKDPNSLDTLAAAYAEAGRFDEAAGAEKEAIALEQQEKWKKAFVSRLQLYESGHTFRERR